MKLFQKLINLVKKYGINANKIELSANDILNLLAGNEINLGSKKITIKSDNFNVDENGNMTCKKATVNGKITSNDATITGGKITISGKGDSTDLLRISEQNNASLFSYMQPIGAGFVYGSSDNAVYIMAGSTSLVSVSDNNGETNITGARIKTPILTQTSLEEKKKNFEKMKDNAIEIINGIDIYKYNLKTENDTDKKHIGFVIGDKYNYSKEVTSLDNTGVDTYSFVSLCCKAIQEQQEQIEELKKEIEKLKGEKNG